MCSVERGQEEGRDAVFFVCVGLKCKGRNENQLAGRHYLSILVQECIDMGKKNRPSPNPVRPALLFFIPPSLSPSLYFIFKIENSSQTELMFFQNKRTPVLSS